VAVMALCCRRRGFAELATLQIGWCTVVESALNFLGARVRPPAPTRGNLVAEGCDVLDQAWRMAVCPKLALMLLVLSFKLVCN